MTVALIKKISKDVFIFQVDTWIVICNFNIVKKAVIEGDPTSIIGVGVLNETPSVSSLIHLRSNIGIEVINWFNENKRKVESEDVYEVFLSKGIYFEKIETFGNVEDVIAFLWGKTVSRYVVIKNKIAMIPVIPDLDKFEKQLSELGV